MLLFKPSEEFNLGIDETLNFLQGVQVTNLDLSDCKLADRQFKLIQAVVKPENLKSIDFSKNEISESLMLQFLEKASNLEDLRLKNLTLSSRFVERLASVLCGKNVSINFRNNSYPHPEAFLHFVQKVQTIKAVDFSGCSLSSEYTNEIIKSLNNQLIKRFVFDKKALAENYKDYPYRSYEKEGCVTFTNTTASDRETITEQQIKFYKACPKIHRVKIENPVVEDSELLKFKEVMQQPETVTQLEIAVGSKITKQAADCFLSSFPNLQHLSLWLSELTTIVTLKINWEKLESLNLSLMDNLKTEEVPTVIGMCTNLKRLDLSHLYLSEKTFQHIQQVLSKMDIKELIITGGFILNWGDLERFLKAVPSLEKVEAFQFMPDSDDHFQPRNYFRTKFPHVDFFI